MKEALALGVHRLRILRGAHRHHVGRFGGHSGKDICMLAERGQRCAEHLVPALLPLLVGDLEQVPEQCRVALRVRELLILAQIQVAEKVNGAIVVVERLHEVRVPV
eukprot:scaffold4659_cov352-Prasinococcus_capsulatus_cf.AAC.3